MRENQARWRYNNTVTTTSLGPTTFPGKSTIWSTYVYISYSYVYVVEKYSELLRGLATVRGSFGFVVILKLENIWILNFFNHPCQIKFKIKKKLS